MAKGYVVTSARPSLPVHACPITCLMSMCSFTSVVKNSQIENFKIVPKIPPNAQKMHQMKLKVDSKPCRTLTGWCEPPAWRSRKGRASGESPGRGSKGKLHQTVDSPIGQSTVHRTVDRPPIAWSALPSDSRQSHRAVDRPIGQSKVPPDSRQPHQTVEVPSASRQPHRRRGG